ncbi:MAG: ion transporter [Akkermansia sp.]|nr:ion transporter [Akkermansia sp.]
MVEKLQRLTHSLWFDILVAAVILVMAVNLGVGLSCPEHAGIVDMIDLACSIFFCVELLVRILAYGRKWYRFFTKGWNLFDFVLITVTMLPFFSSGLLVLRLFRVMKLGRLFSATPQLRILVTALFRSLQPAAGVCLLLLIVIYIYAVIGTEAFAGNDPQRFGSLGVSLASMFSFITIDDWYDAFLTAYYGSDVIQSRVGNGVLAVPSAPEAFGWQAALFFFSYMMMVTFIIMNLFVGVVISSLQSAHEYLKECHCKKNEDGE